MMLGLNSVTRVALLLMWASCVVMALHLPDESAELSLSKVGVACTNSSDCPPVHECLKGVCMPALQKQTLYICIIICPRGYRCCGGECRRSCHGQASKSVA
ncbi:uncharacterized protein LOC143018260 isoform X1 [Oratosquilla oratoria]|uniref:uncharacterized protein LOC143018260 isoform X1 n=1 Tax=Oratosquilla oratoria TaxID=337810 RepID=UPI003F764738